jgi:RNA polymerase sigma factor (sigma-70 family)
LISAEELNLHISGCAKNNRESQKKIYTSFYTFAMAICDRYTKRKEDSLEIINDGFLKVFKEMYRYKPAYANELNSFKGWLKKILIYTAIDYNRKYYKQTFSADPEASMLYLPSDEESALDNMSYKEIIDAIRELSPSYRTVINLFIVDGFSHEEIADKMGIAVGTSKSNLYKARQQLKKILKKDNNILIAKNVG